MHWTDEKGFWSTYFYEDQIRLFCKGVLYGYGTFTKERNNYTLEDLQEVSKSNIIEWVKPSDTCKCIRCGKPTNSFINNTAMCERCINTKYFGNVEYEITPCGFKGNKISQS